MGLNNPHKKDVLHNFVRDHKLDILLIQETKISKEKVEKIKLFQHCSTHGNNSNGALGGIVTF